MVNPPDSVLRILDKLYEYLREHEGDIHEEIEIRDDNDNENIVRYVFPKYPLTAEPINRAELLICLIYFYLYLDPLVIPN
jgi:hypothetical protein